MNGDIISSGSINLFQIFKRVNNGITVCQEHGEAAGHNGGKEPDNDPSRDGVHTDKNPEAGRYGH